MAAVVVTPRRSPRIASLKAKDAGAALEGLKRFDKCFAHLPSYKEEDERTFQSNEEVIKCREAALEQVKLLEPLLRRVGEPLPDEDGEYGLAQSLKYLFEDLRVDILKMKTIEDVTYIFFMRLWPWEDYLKGLLAKSA